MEANKNAYRKSPRKSETLKAIEALAEKYPDNAEVMHALNAQIEKESEENERDPNRFAIKTQKQSVLDAMISVKGVLTLDLSEDELKQVSEIVLQSMIGGETIGSDELRVKYNTLKLLRYYCEGMVKNWLSNGTELEDERAKRKEIMEANKNAEEQDNRRRQEDIENTIEQRKKEIKMREDADLRNGILSDSLKKKFHRVEWKKEDIGKIQRELDASLDSGEFKKLEDRLALCYVELTKLEQDISPEEHSGMAKRKEIEIRKSMWKLGGSISMFGVIVVLFLAGFSGLGMIMIGLTIFTAIVMMAIKDSGGGYYKPSPEDRIIAEMQRQNNQNYYNNPVVNELKNHRHY